MANFVQSPLLRHHQLALPVHRPLLVEEADLVHTVQKVTVRHVLIGVGGGGKRNNMEEYFGNPSIYIPIFVQFFTLFQGPENSRMTPRHPCLALQG